ncbi:hypothetical protein AYY18_05860 [Morganella psychrotolerans]|uniref:Uncharacterized protein n=2 Tax=Morganella psychrotolerans TaxID=368603 RepID=A0A1B8HFA0_9GAMM|nr:hypothetical protein AYY18_05860 [Morganella psychrotolerans]
MSNDLIFEIKIIHNTRYNDISIESFIGNIVLLILSKNLFKYNFEVSDFIYHAFNIKLRPYAINSRTLMVAKICRHLIDMDKYNMKKASILIYDYLMNNIIPNKIDINKDIIVYPKEHNNNNKKEQSNALKNMNIWINKQKNKK